MSTLHGSLTWLCQACAPNFRMMTVLLPGGPQRPVSGRQGGRQAVIPPVDEIADRLAAMSVSRGESDNPNPTNPQETAERDPANPGAGVASGPPPAQGGPPPAQGGPPPAQGGDHIGEDCQLFSKGECPYGISGKKGGVCTSVHRKRCSKFLRWGRKAQRGCKEPSCPIYIQ